MALVERVDDDERPDSCFPEWADNEFLHLRAKRFLSDAGVRGQDRKQLLSEMRIAVSELEGEGGEDGAEVAPVVEISRTKETRTEPPVCKARFGKRLGNGGFSGSGEAVEPEDPFIFFVV